MHRLTTPRLAALSLSLVLAPLAGGCGSSGGTPVILDGGGSKDLGVSADAAIPVDLVVPVDLTQPEPDLTRPPASDMAMGPCSMLGDWTILGMAVTLNGKGEMVYMGTPLAHWTFSGRTFTITDDSSPDCMMEGHYDVTFSADCKEATIKSIGDPCIDREDALSGTTWVRP